MASLNEYFKKDFAQYMTIDQEQGLMDKTSGKTTNVIARVHFDFTACSKFVSLYVPHGAPVKDVVSYYVENIPEALKAADGLEVQMGLGRLEKDTSSKDLAFTGRVIVYSEDEVGEPAKQQLKAIATAKDIRLILRSNAYMNERNRFQRPLAFISYDSRDKSTIAEPIALGLQKLMCPVWYDEYALKVGDSLREAIERGIKEADTCILVLSKNFLANNGWTKAEFDSIYTREIVEKKRVILPVWSGVTREEIYEYSPRLADRVAVNCDLGIEEVVRRLYIAIEGHGRPA